MTRSRKVFIGIMLVFFALLILLMIDISRKTSFPGAAKRQKQFQPDTLKDTIQSNSSANPAIHQP